MAEFNLSYKHTTEGEKTLKIKDGEILFLLGQNGTGKSTIIHNFNLQNSKNARRITAHRQIWFRSDLTDLTHRSRNQFEESIVNVDSQDRSIYQDDYADQRAQIIIFDLIEAENIEARKIVNAIRTGNKEEADLLIKQQPPISKMNDILRMSNLNFRVKIDKGSRLTAEKEGYNEYSISALSDGERNALIIIASVLTAPKNTLILLDEPERHLHRSIVSPLISTLLSYRTDCAFVVSTHDLSLPLDQKTCSTLILRVYSHQQKTWIADYIKNINEMDEELAISILGSRRKVLFIEGNNRTSLDIQIYQILYPEVSVKPVGSCIDVERIVRSIRASEKNHWISAFGIIDRDGKTDEECENLHKLGIFPLPYYSVESLYYHPSVIKAVLNRVASISDIDVEKAMNEIKAIVIRESKVNKDRLSTRLTEKKVKAEALRNCPEWKSILNKESKEVKFSIDALFECEKKRIETAISMQDFETLICRYPLRETPALDLIAKKSSFRSGKEYEIAVKKMLSDSNESLNMVRNLIKPATNNILTTFSQPLEK